MSAADKKDTAGKRGRPWKFQDVAAGGVLIVIGVFVAVNGPSYSVGSLVHMGPGFMPTMLGILMILLGLTIFVSGLKELRHATHVANIMPELPEWRGWGCILASPLVFIFFGSYFGMAPAVFSCVFVAALGDRQATIKTSALLAAGMTIFGVVLFSFLLDVAMPIFQWRGF